MPRTKGFYVRIWRQEAGEPFEDEAPDHAEYLREDGERKLFTTRRAAAEAAEAHVDDEPGLAWAIEPEVR